MTTLYFYDQAGKLLEEYIPATATGKDYVWLPGTYEPLARVDFGLADTDNGDVLRCTKSSSNVHLDWSLDSASGPFVVKRSTSFTFSSPQYLGPAQSGKTFDDGVLNNGINYAYEAFRRVLTDTLYFYHADHLGTSIAMTNGAAALVWRAEHTPFGGIYALTVGTITNNLRFPGQYLDGEMGLAQNSRRDYTSQLGRYIEPDAADMAPRNVYGYAEAGPINKLDPNGLSTEVCCRQAEIPGGSLMHRFGIDHCWLQTSSISAGMGPAWNLPWWIPPIPGEPTKVVPHPRGSGCLELQCVDEACVNNELQLGRRLGGWSPINNCNTFVSQVVKKCLPKKKCCEVPPPPSPPPQHWPGGFY